MRVPRLAPASLFFMVLLAVGCSRRVLPTIAASPGGNDAMFDGGALPDGFVARGSGGGPGTGGLSGAGTGGTRGATKLDLLFMIDDSASMATLQAKLRLQMPTFLDSMLDTPSSRLPDMHVAVVSSSLGAGAFSNVNQCQTGTADSRDLGNDQGRFLQGAAGPNASPCSMLHPGAKFLHTGDGTPADPPNFEGALDAAMFCLTGLGDKGCGFESPFESIYVALAKASQPADRDNAGFLRPEAHLAIIMLTNEDDCSVRGDSLLLSPSVNSTADPSGLGALSSYRCNEFGHLCDGQPPPHEASGLPAAGLTLNNCVSAEDAGKTDPDVTDPAGNPDPTHGHLWPTVQEFGTYLRAFKADPNRVSVVAIAGPTTDVAGKSAYRVVPVVNAAAGGEVDPAVDHSCVQTTTDPSQPEYADPAIRINELVRGFGANGGFFSICASDFSATMQAIAMLLRRNMAAP
jgi:hypothetical protein